MRILITSGGTKVPIDPVRSITNLSTGTLGSALATAALTSNAEVIYLTSVEGKTPFSVTLDCHSFHFDEDILRLKKLQQFCHQYRQHYMEYRYTTYEEYALLLKKVIIEKKPDSVILTAAVSDYLVEHFSTEKIRSSEYLTLQFKPAPKLIQYVKQWLPHTFLVGFKLLIHATDSELVETALHSMQMNDANLIVANNLSSLQQGAHEILLVESDGNYQKIMSQVAETIIARVMRR